MNENSNLKKMIEQLQSQNNNKNNIQIDNSNNSIDTLIKLIKDKENIINELNEKIKRYPISLEKDEKLISIVFSSMSQKTNYSLICKNTDTIHKLEEELYKAYPKLSETENSFIFKGKPLNKFQSFEKANIKNGDNIILSKNK